MPDWSEHAVSIAIGLSVLCGYLLRWSIGFYQRRAQEKEASLAAGLQEVAQAVRDLAKKLDEVAEKWAERLGFVEQRLSHIEGICKERHGPGRREQDRRLAQLEEVLKSSRGEAEE